MHQKDKSEKKFFANNDVFSDIFNSLVFNGEQVIDPNRLKDMESESQLKLDDNSLHTIYRDVIKSYEENDMIIAIMGLENQSRVDRTMPARVLCYNAASILTQLKNKAKRLKPVITLVLYFGKEEWKARYRKIEFDLDPRFKELEKFLPQQEIIVIDVPREADKALKFMKTDFKVFCEFMTMRRTGKYPESLELDHVTDFLDVVNAIDRTLMEEVEKNASEGVKEQMLSYTEKLKAEAGKEIIMKSLKAAKEEGRSLDTVFSVLLIPKKDQQKYLEMLKDNNSDK